MTNSAVSTSKSGTNVFEPVNVDMKALKMSLNTEAERVAFLETLCEKLNLGKLPISNYNDCLYIETPFEECQEGINIGVFPNEELLPMGGSTLVEAGLMKAGWHVSINAWPNSWMPKKELARMKKMVADLLVLVPKATLFFEDDGSMDYNPNSDTPSGGDYYTCKFTDANRWKEQFNFED